MLLAMLELDIQHAIAECCLTDHSLLKRENSVRDIHNMKQAPSNPTNEKWNETDEVNTYEKQAHKNRFIWCL